MNFMGMGFMELTVVLIIAFLVLGPTKFVEMSRTLGKLVGGARKTLADINVSADLNSPPSNPQPPPPPPPAPQQPPVEPAPPSGSVPTTGPGEGNEQQS